MRDDRIPAAAAPWSFFVPIALAVLVGGLVSGLILRSLDAPQAGDAADRVPPAGEAKPERPPPAPETAPTVAVEPRRPDAATAAVPEVADDKDAAAPPALPGALLARRDGAPAACINGTIALRDENGWQQQLENDAPVACVEAPVPAP